MNNSSWSQPGCRNLVSPSPSFPLLHSLSSSPPSLSLSLSLSFHFPSFFLVITFNIHHTPSPVTRPSVAKPHPSPFSLFPSFSSFWLRSHWNYRFSRLLRLSVYNRAPVCVCVCLSVSLLLSLCLCLCLCLCVCVCYRSPVRVQVFLLLFDALFLRPEAWRW